MMQAWQKSGLAALLLAALFFAAVPLRAADATPYELDEFGKLPVLLNGRIKPIDTVARTSLLMIHGKQTLRSEHSPGFFEILRRIFARVRGETIVRPDSERTLSAIEWLAEVCMRPTDADGRKIFVLTNPDTLGALGWQQDQGKNFSFTQLEPHLQEIDRQAQLAAKIDEKLRSPFQRDITKLYERIALYFRLKNSLQPADATDFRGETEAYVTSIGAGIGAIDNRKAGRSFDGQALDQLARAVQRYAVFTQNGYFYPIPPTPPEVVSTAWKKMGDGLVDAVKTGQLDPATNCYAGMVSAFSKKDAAGFNASVHEYQKWLAGHPGKFEHKPRIETFFNQLEPFYKSMVCYVLVFILACASWLAWPEKLARAAFGLIIAVFILHSAGLGFRMYLEGRPPVTNLYSSAIFIGWGAVLLGILLERFYRNGIGSATASIIGFVTLLIAHHLSLDGDTMEMMRAVLDTNGWLATHVVAVTLGYASTFLAGFLALMFIIRGFFTSSLSAETAKSLGRMVYGIVCFATLFSFVGTILGGIWADQSWGRFWGWDPKENGAALIVLWNAIILHARWGGMVGARGLMVMAVFGNVVTSWSWFGVNMLGVGLHSYGFMESAFPWLIGFCISQGIFMLIGMLPLKLWRSPMETRAATPDFAGTAAEPA